MGKLYEIVRTIRETKGTKAKEALLEDALCLLGQDELLSSLLVYAFDWTKTIGITVQPLPEVKTQYDELSLKDVVELAQKRYMTGNEARQVVSNVILRGFDCDDAEVVMDFLNKNPRLGIAEKSLEKVVPGLVPKWTGCMLAKKWEGEPLKFPVFIEPKIDGMRCLIVMSENGATAYTREGHELPQVQFICDQITEALREARSVPLYVFDGELFTKDWNTTLKLAKTEKEIDRSELMFHCFDALLRKEWEVGYSNRKIGEYRDELINVIQSQPNIRSVPRHQVNNLEEMNAFYDTYLQEGYEGIMIKRVDGRYECKRSSDWLKYKPETTADYPIVGTFEGKGKFRDTLGGLVLDKGNGVELGVGSGFTDAIRANLWGSRDNLAGKMCEVKFQPGRDGAAEFAVFVRIREDL